MKMGKSTINHNFQVHHMMDRLIPNPQPLSQLPRYPQVLQGETPSGCPPQIPVTRFLGEILLSGMDDMMIREVVPK